MPLQLPISLSPLSLHNHLVKLSLGCLNPSKAPCTLCLASVYMSVQWPHNTHRKETVPRFSLLSAKLSSTTTRTSRSALRPTRYNSLSCMFSEAHLLRPCSCIIWFVAHLNGSNALGQLPGRIMQGCLLMQESCGNHTCAVPQLGSAGGREPFCSSELLTYPARMASSGPQMLGQVPGQYDVVARFLSQPRTAVSPLKHTVAELCCAANLPFRRGAEGIAAQRAACISILSHAWKP